MFHVNDTIAADPHFVMAHCLRGDQFMMDSPFTLEDKARSAPLSAQACDASARDRMHLAARARLRPQNQAAVERHLDVSRRIKEAA